MGERILKIIDETHWTPFLVTNFDFIVDDTRLNTEEGLSTKLQDCGS